MITIQGLSPRQYQLADQIWSCDSQEDVKRFIAALPGEYKQDAELVHDLMVAAVFDEQLEITQDVADLIVSISSR